jgi:hypothetical protein
VIYYRDQILALLVGIQVLAGRGVAAGFFSSSAHVSSQQRGWMDGDP